LGERRLQYRQYLVRSEAAPDLDGEAAPGVFIGHGKKTPPTPVLRGIFDEIVGPHVISVSDPERQLSFLPTASTPFLVRVLHPVVAPHPMHAFVVQHAPGPLGQFCSPSSAAWKPFAKT
jgi:hypothetical protein